MTIENVNDPHSQQFLRGHDMPVRAKVVNVRINISYRLYVGLLLGYLEIRQVHRIGPIRNDQLQRKCSSSDSLERRLCSKNRRLERIICSSKLAIILFGREVSHGLWRGIFLSFLLSIHLTNISDRTVSCTSGILLPAK